MFRTGQTVRWSPEFAAWFGRDGVTGRISSIRRERASCPLCALAHVVCPGPWYMVDFDGHPDLCGLYAEHQLQAA